MDVETVFRGSFGIKKEHDLVELIEAAVNVAGLTVPDKLRKHRGRIIKLLFDDDPAHPTDLFSDDEVGLDNDGDSNPSAELATDDSKTVALPPKNVKKGFMKAVELSASPPPPSTSEKIVDNPDNSMKLKLEAEKKGKRKIGCVDFPEPKKHCRGGGKAKAPSGDVRQRIASRMKKMKTGNGKPKYNLHSGLM